jgi:hypothetical protein
LPQEEAVVAQPLVLVQAAVAVPAALAHNPLGRRPVRARKTSKVLGEIELAFSFPDSS